MTTLEELAKDVADNAVSLSAELAASPQDAINLLAATRRDLDRIERHIVRRMRDDGWTWQEIADEYGITRQAAHERFHGAI
jgi:DNA invertase Pin-like site-specific DNA recombinase